MPTAQQVTNAAEERCSKCSGTGQSHDGALALHVEIDRALASIDVDDLERNLCGRGVIE